MVEPLGLQLQRRRVEVNVKKEDLVKDGRKKGEEKEKKKKRIE